MSSTDQPHLKAVGVGGVPHSISFNNKMVNEYHLKEGTDFTWTFSSVRDDKLGARWKAVLVAWNVWGGGMGTYEGYGNSKGGAKDEGAREYLLANGLVAHPPLEE